MAKSILALSFFFAITLNAQDFQTAIASCVNDCHLEQFTGEQHISAPVTIDPTATVYLSRNVRIMADAKITLPFTASIQGGIAPLGGGAKITAEAGFSGDALIECDGPCHLGFLTLDGAASTNPNGKYPVLFINRAYSGDHSFVVAFELNTVQVQFGPNEGILVYSDPLTPTESMGPRANQSCCGKLTLVRSVFNRSHGMLINNTADGSCLQCEFESNGASGVMLLNAPTWRWVQSDFGGNNKADGLSIGPGSCGQIITGVQFGGNQSPLHDYSGACNVQHTQSAVQTL